MIKIFKNIFFLLALITCISVTQFTPVLASGSTGDQTIIITPRASEYINNFGGSLTVNDNVATVFYYMAVNTGISCRADVYLQYYENGDWKTLTSWTDTDSSVFLVNEKDVTVYSGKTYRAVVNYRAMNGIMNVDVREKILTVD